MLALSRACDCELAIGINGEVKIISAVNCELHSGLADIIEIKRNVTDILFKMEGLKVREHSINKLADKVERCLNS